MIMHNKKSRLQATPLNRLYKAMTHHAALLLAGIALVGCGGGGGGGSSSGDDSSITETSVSEVATASTDNSEQSLLDALGDTPNALDEQLVNLIINLALDNSDIARRDLPSINDPLAQLGKKLFFSKSLGGGFDAACASCHHPLLGGGDDLALPIGTLANDPLLLGQGREHQSGQPQVPRHSPTVFNVGLWDRGLFWDSRVESLNPVAGANGADGDIRTPDTAFNISDPNAGDNPVSYTHLTLPTTPYV